MKTVKQTLAKFSIGRIFLHLACLRNDHKTQWHLAGIKRELKLVI